jgi:DNA-binding response OmpR family regulator
MRGSTAPWRMPRETRQHENAMITTLGCVTVFLNVPRLWLGPQSKGARHVVYLMVVEDEKDIRAVIVDMLTDAGFNVLEATTAHEAVALLRDERIRLIVTDINLPGRMDGIALAHAARKQSPSIPVVFISGRPDKLIEARIIGHPSVFLQKPFSFGALVASVERLVSAA